MNVSKYNKYNRCADIKGINIFKREVWCEFSISFFVVKDIKAKKYKHQNYVREKDSCTVVSVEY